MAKTKSYSHFDVSNKDTSEESSVVLSKLRDRDPVFLTALFSELNPKLLGMLASQGIYNEHAEELIHQCWETFFSNLEKFEGRSKIKTFIFGILIFKIKENRRKNQKLEFEEDSQKIFDRSFTKDGWWIQQPSDPYRIVENRQLSQAIQECLEGLSESQKNAFLLIESVGETSEEVCQILGVSLANLRVLIFRAKDKLRTCLEGQYLY